MGSVTGSLKTREFDINSFTDPKKFFSSRFDSELTKENEKLGEIIIDDEEKISTYESKSLHQEILAITSFDEPYNIITKSPIYEVGDHELLIENKVIGLNPIDWKSKKYKFAIYDFPWINGRESSGIVTKKGKSVKNFELGDNIIAGSTSYRDNRTSTFQKYSIIDSRLAWRLPEKWSLEDGATLGVGLITAGVLLNKSFGLDIKQTHVSTSKESIETILIWGGSTVVGMYLTQLSKIVGLNVISVAGAHNEDYLKSLGADYVIDRFEGDNLINDKILAISNTNGIQYGVDCVSEKSSRQVLEILNNSVTSKSLKKKDKLPLFAGIVAVPKEINPELNVVVKDVIIKQFHEDITFGEGLIGKTTALMSKSLIKPVKYKKFTGDLNSIVKGLTELESNGASAEKYVVSLE